MFDLGHRLFWSICSIFGVVECLPAVDETFVIGNTFWVEFYHTVQIAHNLSCMSLLAIQVGLVQCFMNVKAVEKYLLPSFERFNVLPC
jgi:hypothetical protein